MILDMVDERVMVPEPARAHASRPLSSTAASIILNPDDSVHMVLGGSGGSRIFPSLAQVLLNVQCGLNLSAAIERPRVHNQIVPPVTTLEVGPEGVHGEWKALVDGLKARGHDVGLFDINIAISEGTSLLSTTSGSQYSTHRSAEINPQSRRSWSTMALSGQRAIRESMAWLPGTEHTMSNITTYLHTAYFIGICTFYNTRRRSGT